jgi:23S rRNA (pseudouridine1915-N3)-methyltransferase
MSPRRRSPLPVPTRPRAPKARPVRTFADRALKLTILAIGRLARSPETDLVKTYVERATNAGRALGLGPLEVIEVESRKPGKAAEAEALRPHLADASHGEKWIIACDEHGTARPSRAFAEEIATLRDRGVRRLVFLIGGADGLAPDLLGAANGKLAFGPQTWPHALARAMLAEQIYRAVTILAGSPYHRD